ncbi:MAG: phosphocholine cytidylyltransferase family protein [Candidatus Latescibacterota bacterium]|nr:phosphocholine cytidylyltransferase family protein [Candidatus Latescibacterota bacterium]
MRAIVLAAGLGTRLKPLTDSCPKCLVTIKGKALIDYQLDALELVGVDDIVVVVGAMADQVRAHCGNRVRYIENPQFSTTNSIYSLYLASQELCEEIFLFNCDILFHSNVLKMMLEEPKGNVLAVDTQVARVPDEMNVCFDLKGRIVEINKNIEPARAQAQSVQLIKFDSSGAKVLGEEVTRLIQADNTETFPTAAYEPILKRYGIFITDVSDFAWGEIDNLEDYKYVCDHVVPSLGI